MAEIIQQITDANGKNFSVNISKICDINGDLGEKESASITDSKKNRVLKVHDVEYVDQNGNTIDSMQLLKDMSSNKTSVLALDVEMEATHSGKNHNYCIYYEDSMEKDAESFVNPFKKPVLKNHNSYDGEPLGRILQSWHGPSALTDERSAIHLKARITDKDSIPKFLDGRYGTVSIGGSMGTVTCNICGKTILKDGKFKFCGHWRGESYKNEVCYWGAKDIEYHEVSTVNNPADDFAQIMKVTVITDDNKNNKEEDNMSDVNTNKDSKVDDVKKSVCDMIDQLLGNVTSTTDASDESSKETVEDGATEDKTTEDTTTVEEKVEEVVTDSADNTDETEQLKKDLADANEKNAAIEAELQQVKDELAKVKEDLTVAQTEVNDMKEKCVVLATTNKELVVDSIIAKESLTEENKDSRREELLGKSMKELNDLQKENETQDTKANRTLANVSNPTLANTQKDNKDSNGKADVNKETTDNNTAKKTVEDFANDIVGKLFK